MADTKQRCTNCQGSGEVTRHTTETTTETDYTMGIVLGAALGTGFFPSTRTVVKPVTKKERCSWCYGTGRR